MPDALPYNAHTIFVFTIRDEAITAQPVGAVALPGGRSRVVLLDADGRYYVVEVDTDRFITVVAGPVSGAKALHAAECVITGISSHRPVSALIMDLSVALVARELADRQRRAMEFLEAAP